MTIRHADSEMIVRAGKAFETGALLQEFIPCPQALRDTEAAYYPDSDPRKAELESKEAENINTHGHTNWYDWQVANWGTKWDIGNEDGVNSVSDNELIVCFDSAWSPPVTAYWTLEEQGFEIEAFYYEPGMAFCGSWINGVDKTYDIPLTSAEADKIIPEDIDEMFDIVNTMAMWEEEEA